MRPRKPIIGLCGGIGAGKSLVAREFERLGAVVIDSDRLSHEILARPAVLDQVRGWWGEQVVTAEGGPNRQRIAELVFADPEKRRRLESVLHPLIAAEREYIISRSTENPAVRAIILDSPLLFESRLDRLCDKIVFVEAGEQVRLARLRETRGWELEQVRRREQWQMPLDRKRARSDFTVTNEGSPEQLRSAVAAVFERIVSEAALDR
jgi:dephospho-CoA kinase